MYFYTLYNTGLPVLIVQFSKHIAMCFIVDLINEFSHYFRHFENVLDALKTSLGH